MAAIAVPDVNEHIIKATRAIEIQVGQVLLGKPEQVRIASAALVCGEHLLLNDLPGVGKTTLGVALSKVIDGSFGRVQGTSDLMPTDLTGITMYDQSTSTWVYRSGPLMNNVILVDELNRLTPRTQSALLEAMAEGHVTVDGTSRVLPKPFMVVATMNPVGSAGTFPLTAGQLDRFGASLRLGSPDRAAERKILRGDGGADHLNLVSSVVPANLLPELQRVVSRVHLEPGLLDYALNICDHLRSDFHLSTRAPKSILNMARAISLFEGRSFVLPDDIKGLAVPCLAHRVVEEGQPLDTRSKRVLEAVKSIPVPAVSA